MVTTRNFNETIYDFLRESPEFAVGLVEEAAELHRNDEANVAALLLVDFINGLTSHAQIASDLNFSIAELQRRLDPESPTVGEGLAEIITHLRGVAAANVAAGPVVAVG